MNKIKRFSQSALKRISTYILLQTPEKVIGSSGVKIIKIVTESVNENGIFDDPIQEETIQSAVIKLVTAIHFSNLSDDEMVSMWSRIFDLWSLTIDYCDISFLCDKDEYRRMVSGLQLDMKNVLEDRINNNDLNRFLDMLNIIKNEEVVSIFFLKDNVVDNRKKVGKLLRRLWTKLFGRDEKVGRTDSSNSLSTSFSTSSRTDSTNSVSYESDAITNSKELDY